MTRIKELMVYQNNFVVAIKVNGKILREKSDVVALPFGSEYSIYIKNQKSVRALARVSIDGENINDDGDGWFIVGANDSLELERFIRNSNLNKGNKFKFIERTKQIEDHRGIGADDGLVRVEYKFEIVPKQVHYDSIYYPVVYPPPYVNSPWIYVYPPYNTGQPCVPTCTTINTADTNNSNSPDTIAAISNSCGKSILRSNSMESHVNMCLIQETEFNDNGITVAGSESNQEFVYSGGFPTEDTSQVIVLKLLGKVGNAKVENPITVKQKPICTTCGKVNKATHQFCGRCGTALTLF